MKFFFGRDVEGFNEMAIGSGFETTNVSYGISAFGPDQYGVSPAGRCVRSIPKVILAILT